MSSSEQPTTVVSNVQPSTSPNHDNQPLPPAPPPPPPVHDLSSPASDSTIRMSRASSSESHPGPTTVPGGTEGRMNSGLGMGTPLPPVPPALHQQAQNMSTTHIQSPTSLMVAQTMSESPSSIASSVPRASPLPHSQRLPTPPLPPIPIPGANIQRPQTAVSRSSTGVSAPGRSLSFVDAPPPGRHGSTGARTSSGQGYNTTNRPENNGNPNSNSNNNVYRHGDRRMSSFSSSMEKAGAFLEQDPARLFHVDLGYNNMMNQQQQLQNVDQRDPRYRDSGVSMPVPGLHVQVPLDGGDGDGNGNGNGRPRPRANTSDSIGVPLIPRTVQERIQPTINHAMEEELKYARKAKFSGYALNIAIGLQVFISALITALSAVTTGRRTQIMTSVLGGAGTVVASYLARARGSNEPELSIARTKDLQHFIRTCDAFVQDHGLETGFEDSEGKQGGTRNLQRAKELDERINELRVELEHLLGNGDGERRLSPPV